MLSFTEQLKELIYEVERNGGSIIQKLAPPTDLVLKLKGYAIKKLKEETQALPKQVEFFLLEEFNEGFFEEGVRVSLVHLAEMGLTKTSEVQKILTKVIDNRLAQILDKDKKRFDYSAKDRITIDDAIVQSVEYIWEEYGSEPTVLYNFARQRFLIIWDYQRNIWQATGLGRFILELKPIQAITFLLTIDLTFNTGDNDYKYLSVNSLRALIKPSHRQFNRHIIPLHRETLKLLGVIRSKSERHWEYELTPIGKTVIESVLSDDNPMTEIVTALIQNEEQGIHFEGSEKELNELTSQLKSDIIDKSNFESVKNAVLLFKKGSYVDASRILFPSIESIVNDMLQFAGENPNDHKKFPGLVKKVNRLEELNLIPTDLSRGIEIATSRNKVLHGEYEPLEQEYAYPLCIAAIIYLRRILNEFRKIKRRKEQL